jgi:hypothetical protein
MSMNENNIKNALSPKEFKKEQINFYDIINNENMESIEMPSRNLRGGTKLR